MATAETHPFTGTVYLTHLAALDVTGPDAEKFLQGQTSAQVGLANGHFAPLTCFCTPKGACWPMPSYCAWRHSTIA